MSEESARKRPRRDHDRSAKGGIPQANPFVEMLNETTINDVVPHKKVVTLTSERTVEEAMQLLGRFKILSAPVIDSKVRHTASGAPQTNDLLGFVDVRDLASLCLKVFVNEGKTKSEGGNGAVTGLEKLRFDQTRAEIEVMNSAFLNTNVKDIIDLSRGDPSLAVSGLSPVFQTIGLFQKGVNRVTVLGPDGKAENVISQSDIVRFLVAKLDDFPDIFEHTAAESGLARKKNLIRIHKNEPAMKAVQLLVQHKISAVAVIDDDGSLVANFSASDLKGRGVTNYGEGSDPFGILMQPVLAFLKQGGMSFFPVATVRPETSFQLVLLKLMAMRVHRLWVVEEGNHPVGVITLTDVMLALISQKQADRKE